MPSPSVQGKIDFNMLLKIGHHINHRDPPFPPRDRGTPELNLLADLNACPRPSPIFIYLSEPTALEGSHWNKANPVIPTCGRRRYSHKPQVDSDIRLSKMQTQGLTLYPDKSTYLPNQALAPSCCFRSEFTLVESDCKDTSYRGEALVTISAPPFFFLCSIKACQAVCENGTFVSEVRL